MQIPNISKYLLDSDGVDRTVYLWHGQPLKSSELRDKIYRCARYFSSKYQTRDPVILSMDDCPEWIIAFHAMILIGIIPVVVDYRSSDIIKKNIRMRTSAMDILSDPSDIKYHDGDVDPFHYNQHDDVAYYTTSGTTGTPKIVVYQHRAFCRLTSRMQYLEAENATVLCPAKMSFVVGLIVNVLGPWIMRSQNVIYDLPTSSLRTLYQVINRHKVSHFFTNPTILKIFNQNRLAVMGNHLSHVFVSAEPLPESIAVMFEQKFGIRPINVYGATETLCSVLINKKRSNNITDLGQPVNDCDFRIVDDQDNDQPPGVPGQLLVNSPCGASRYHDDQTELSCKFHNGWYRTGDIVCKIDDRYVFIDRVDGYIKVRGHQVSSLDIENLLTKLPGVVESTVAFDQHNDGTPKIVAYIVSDRGDFDCVKVRSELMKITTYNHLLPDQVYLVDRLPRTLNNKKIKNLDLLDRSFQHAAV